MRNEFAPARRRAVVGPGAPPVAARFRAPRPSALQVNNVNSPRLPRDPDFDLLQARSAMVADNAEAALVHAQAALRSELRPWARSVATLLMRHSLWRLGRIGELGRHEMPASTSNVSLLVHHLCLLSAVEADHLRLSSARVLAVEAHAIAGEAACLRAPAAAVLAESLHEEGIITQGWYERHLAWVQENRVSALVDVSISAYRVVAQVRAQHCQNGHAEATMAALADSGSRRSLPRMQLVAGGELVRLSLEEGDLAKARASHADLEAVADAVRLVSTDTFDLEVEHSKSQARIVCASGEPVPDELMRKLRNLQLVATSRGKLRVGLALRVLSALLEVASGFEEAAFGTLSGAIKQAAASGAYRCLMDDEIRLRNLFKRLTARRGLDHEVNSCLLWLRRRRRNDIATCSPLTPRERSVFALLAPGFSNKEIARTLGIAPETVKSHLRTIFDKLGVANRAEAVGSGSHLSFSLNTGPTVLSDRHQLSSILLRGDDNTLMLRTA